MKTKKSAIKRCKINKTGVIKHKKTNLRHKLTKKSSKRKMSLRQMKILNKSSKKSMLKLISNC